MSILKQIIDSLEGDKNIDQVREICDKISDEEIPKMDEYIGPKGANIFLSLPAVDMDHECTFLTLERETFDDFIIGVWKRIKQIKVKDPTSITLGSLSRIKAVLIKSDRPEKIIEEYAKMLKYLKGE